MRIVVVSLILILGGCAASSQITLPDGRKGFTVDCGGSANTWSSCYQKAGELCPAGYETLTSNQDSHPNGYGAVIERAMVIHCK